MATARNEQDAGRLKLANATPFTWKKCNQEAKGESSWNFPETVQPGQTVDIAIAFDGGKDAHGKVGYKVTKYMNR